MSIVKAFAILAGIWLGMSLLSLALMCGATLIAERRVRRQASRMWLEVR